MTPFEHNSSQLLKDGWRFGMVILRESIDEMPQGSIVPLWAHDEKSSATHLYVLLGSEPKLGKNQPTEIERTKFEKLIPLTDEQMKNKP